MREVGPKRQARMRDVAKLAGVGTMTVSRVLNGTAHVSELTSTRVYRAIEELQYTPNPVARVLRGSRSHTIGVLLPYLYDPFFATCAHAISEVAQENGYSVVLTTTNEDAAAELDAARQMVRRSVDGLIVIPASPGNVLSDSHELFSVPIVALDRQVSGSGFDTVQTDNKHAAALAADHLIGHGHRKIAFIGLSQRLSTINDRYIGYAASLRRAGLQVNPHFDCNTYDRVAGVLRNLVASARPPSALFSANGLITRYVLQALAELKIAVPETMALIAFDDFELAELMQPSLTVVRQPVVELGRRAASLLLDHLSGVPRARSRRTIVLPAELVLRGSCGCHTDPRH